MQMKRIAVTEICKRLTSGVSGNVKMVCWCTLILIYSRRESLAFQNKHRHSFRTMGAQNQRLFYICRF